MAALAKDKKIAVIGAGAMGSGIAQVAATAGYSVKLYDLSADACKKGMAGIEKSLQRFAAKEKITADDVTATLARLETVNELDALADCALIIEAVLERLDVKQQLFDALEDLCPATTQFASNTSTISITEIASALKNPTRLAGLHFFNPAPLMPLVECVAGLQTDPELVQMLHDTCLEWGKSPVKCKSTPGFIVNRVGTPFYLEGMRALESGVADAATIDTVLKQCGGFPMGPLTLIDMVGNDISFAASSSIMDAYQGDPKYKPPFIQRDMIKAGLYGRKSGAGFYDYSNGTPELAVEFHPPQACPELVVISGYLGVAQGLSKKMQDAGVKAIKQEGSGAFVVGNGMSRTSIALTDGRTASERATESGINNTVLFDICVDFYGSEVITLTVADQAGKDALNQAAGLFQAIGKQVLVIDDYPGMLVMRSVCTLANEAADAIIESVASHEEIDAAMKGGMAVPKGPIKWAEHIGLERVLAVLENLHRWYGDGRYRPSAALRRKVMAGEGFYPLNILAKAQQIAAHGL